MCAAGNKVLTFPPFRCLRPLSIGLLTLMAVASGAEAQEGYPNRPVRIIVPTAPGGGNDVTARLIAQGLSERMGRQFVVENRTGAAGLIGGELVARSKPDGYTLLMAAAALAVHPATVKKMPYDWLRDFAAITQAVSLPSLIVVHPSFPAQSVREMIALAKSKPGEILFASGGHGTQAHLAIELLADMAKIRMFHVPYKGTTPGLIDLLAGQVPVMAGNMLQLIPYVRTGRLRALGVTTARRVDAAPEIPTIAESGLPGYESFQWYGLLAPAGTPREVIDRLYKESVAVLRTLDSKQRLASDGADVVASSPEEFSAFIQMETQKLARVAKAAGIRPK